MSAETVARRYSTALADVAIKNGEAETVKAELETWKQMVETSADLSGMFKNPAIAHTGKEKVLEKLISATGSSKTVANFLRVLLKNGRFSELGEIYDRFVSVLAERSGLVSAEVTSARELSEEERKSIETSLSKATGCKVTLNYSVDSDIIGGVITRVGSTVYDGSVRTQLENLRRQLVNG
jgi:F-type H+-transporting ATPase subunit delta